MKTTYVIIKKETNVVTGSFDDPELVKLIDVKEYGVMTAEEWEEYLKLEGTRKRGGGGVYFDSKGAYIKSPDQTKKEYL